MGYTQLNVERSKRVEKTVTLTPELIDTVQALEQQFYWIVLTEAWCPDSAQNIPVLAKITDASPTIELRLLLRDDNPEVMDAFLTNGGKSIPKLICLRKEDLQLMGTWGPRPEPAQQILLAHKQDPHEPYQEVVIRLQKWYAKDRGKTLQEEIIRLLQVWTQEEPATQSVHKG